MKTIVVAGAHSTIGKTSFAEELLRRLPNWSALKVTTVKSRDLCPRRSNCGVCRRLVGKFAIIKGTRTINQKGSDTARLKQAGARKVLWLRATLQGLKSGLKKALALLQGAEGIVIEGTSVLRHLRPDLAIYLKDKGVRLNGRQLQAQRRADVVINVGR